tara:strand:- start:761 stop:940 length:180 start_codon:yes stop_codon:yes gene_type:complete
MNSYEIMGNCAVCTKNVKRDSAYETMEWDRKWIYLCANCASMYGESELMDHFNQLESES